MAGNVKNILQEHFPQIHRRVLYKSCNTVGNNFSYKDKIPEECVSNLIYKYTCDSCNAFYIGKTQLQFRCRIAQHKGISARTGDKLTSKNNSDIYAHSLKCEVYRVSQKKPPHVFHEVTDTDQYMIKWCQIVKIRFYLLFLGENIKICVLTKFDHFEGGSKKIIFSKLSKKRGR